jgi:hypothetical protein
MRTREGGWVLLTTPRSVPGVLCYVDGAWGFFTTSPMPDQWGDDWNDAPYEHNAGAPYENEGAKVTRVAWYGPFETPDSDHTNSPWSVEQINAGHIAWLRPSKYGPNSKGQAIFAGATFDAFARIIQAGGGQVFVGVPSDG